jgi:hypothetical protein
MGEKRTACRIFVGKPESKRPLGRPRRRWKAIIELNLTEIRWNGVDYINLDQDNYKQPAAVNAVMILRVP